MTQPTEHPAGLLAQAEADLPPGIEAYPSQIGIFCDDCGHTELHDYVVHSAMTRGERLDVARRHLVNQDGWSCTPGLDLCPPCHRARP